MKIPFKKERQLSTSELPGVICSPALVFHFDAAPTIDFIREFSAWAKDKDDELETIRLGAALIRGVTLPDNTKYELGTPDAMADLASQTTEEFIPSLLTGWWAFIQTERLADMGKLRPLLALLSDNGGKNDKA